VRRIGVLMGFAESDQAAQSWVAAFGHALAKLGWEEGSNLRIELRWGAADPDRIRTLAKELVDLQPDAIFDQTTPVTAALARETTTIPIVFTYVGDPIGRGFAASLARPGGNITGFTYLEPKDWPRQRSIRPIGRRSGITILPLRNRVGKCEWVCA
jgi:putative tryptophan/tyrosine transport system substrate-binding protein